MSSPMQGFERDTLAAVLNSKRVWLTHIVANALLVIAFFYWTRIPDETGWQVALSVVAALLIVFVTLWLHTATFVYFKRTSERQWGASLRSALPRVPAFFLWTVIFGLVLWGIGGLWDYSDQAGGYIRHLLPQATRRAITPPSSFSAVHWFIWFLNFFLFPILVLPVGAQAATRGFRGFVSRAAFRPVREVRYWLAYLVCFLIGAYLPYRLAWMLPEKPSALSAQSWSMVLRLGFGYLLLVTAWVVLCAAIMRAIDEDDLDAAETKPALIFNSGAAIAITHQALLMLRDWRVVCLQLASAAVVTATADLSSFGEKNWQIGLGTTGVVLLLLVFLWLQAGTLVYAAEPDPQRFRTAFRLKWSRLAWSLLSGLVLLVLMLETEGLIQTLWSQSSSSMVKDAFVFFLVPSLVLPWIMAKVGIGCRLRAGVAAIRRWEYWLGMAVIILVAGWLSGGVLSLGLGSDHSSKGILRFAVLLTSNLPYVVGWLLMAGLLGYFVNANRTGASTNVLGQTVS